MKGHRNQYEPVSPVQIIICSYNITVLIFSAVRDRAKRSMSEKRNLVARGEGVKGMIHTFTSLCQTLIFNDKYKLNYCKMQFLKKKSSTIHGTISRVYPAGVLDNILLQKY